MFGTESSRSHERGSSPFAINVSGLKKSKKDTAGKKTLITNTSNQQMNFISSYSNVIPKVLKGFEEEEPGMCLV